MPVFYQDDAVTVHAGDCIDVLKTLPDNSIDAVCTDPPYGISFMGKQWDQPGEFGSRRCAPGENKHRGHKDAALNAGRYDLSPPALLNFQQWCQTWATECLRVLKPGGHMLAFGGSRTWHRLASAVEDAGFEIRDSIAWLYGSGFPKSLNVSKAIDKSAGAERVKVQIPASEVRNPKATGSGRDGTAGATRPWIEAALERGYHEKDGDEPATDAAKQWAGWGTALKPAFEPIVVARKPIQGTVAANVLAHGTGALNIDACRVSTNGEVTAHPPLSTNRHEGYQRPWNQDSAARARIEASRDAAHDKRDNIGRWPTNVVLDDEMAAELDRQSGTLTSGKLMPHHADNGKPKGTLGAYSGAPGRESYGDAGGASRFFPTFRYTAKAATSERPAADGVAHPTVKPLELMRWLIRLVTPPGGTVLDPFAGSGTTGEAAILEHKHAVLIERETDYLGLIKARLTKPLEVGFDFEEVSGT